MQETVYFFSYFLAFHFYSPIQCSKEDQIKPLFFSFPQVLRNPLPCLGCHQTSRGEVRTPPIVCSWDFLSLLQKVTIPGTSTAPQSRPPLRNRHLRLSSAATGERDFTKMLRFFVSEPSKGAAERDLVSFAQMPVLSQKFIVLEFSQEGPGLLLVER